jgi:aspartate/methionine/tyrosine aminotransferase
MANCIKSKMRKNFSLLSGGLFAEVSKADVGGGFAKLEREGVSMMSWADPFYPDPSLPPALQQKAFEIIKEGIVAHYTMPIGNEILKEEISVKLKRENNINADPRRNIIITPGSDSGLLYAMMPFIEAGDEVLVHDPSYPSNFLNAELLGGKSVAVPLKKKDNYRLDIEAFEKALTPKTKMVLLTNPNNPTTTVFLREDLEDLAAFIVKNDLICVADQAFESTIFDNREMVSIATLQGMEERTITVFSISKGMGLSGFRVGYLVASDVIMDVLHASAVNVLGATNTLSQLLAIEAFRNPSFIEEYNKKHDKRRRYAYDVFSKIPGVEILMPESGFMCWLDVSELGDSSDVYTYLIEEAKVACNDGKSYGKLGEGHLRLVIGCYWDDDKSIDAMHRVAEALRKLSLEKGLRA